MDIFSVFTLCGGLAFFLYGMTVMSQGLEKIAGGKMEKLLQKMTANPIKSLMLGAGITMAIQSSSAVTVMLVGLVNSGIMKLSQSVGVIMGSNVGTTITAWILSLSGIESSNFFVKLLKPESFSPVLALIGVIMLMAAQSNRRKNTGTVLLGFAVLMYGMELMKTAMVPLAEMPSFTNLLTAFSNPIFGIIIGTVVTAIIQSSSASVGILQALSMTGTVSYGMAIPIIMGQNIGTCISAIISSIGVNTNARRVAVVHVSFNIIGVIVFMAIFELGNFIFKFSFVSQDVTPFSIAICHTIFNIFTTIMLFPFANLLEKIALTVVKEKSSESKVILDERLLNTPTFAIGQCYDLTVKMAQKVSRNLVNSVKLLKDYQEKNVEVIERTEARIDQYEDTLGTFLLKLSGKELPEEVTNQITQLMLSIGDFERIGDHCARILNVAKRMNAKNLTLTDKAIAELKVAVNAVKEVYDMTLHAFEYNDKGNALEIEPLEQVIDVIIHRAKKNHIKRLQENECLSEMSFMYADVLNDLERISDHCSAIAAYIIQAKHSSMEKHELRHQLHDKTNVEFVKRFNFYKEKYNIEENNTVSVK